MTFFKPPPKPARPPMSGTMRPAPAKPARPALPANPPPLPEVTEGNQDSDWAMWEDSVAFQDSQLPSVFNDLNAVKTRDEPPKKNEAILDPFSTLRKRDS